MNRLVRWLRDLGRKHFWPVLRHFYIVERVFAESAVLEGNDVQNLRVLLPAGRIQMTSPHDDPFVPIGRYYKEGWFDRPNVFVCDVPEAYLYVDGGMVCTRGWKVMADFDVRLTFFKKFGKRRPRHVRRLSGTFSTIGYGMDSNHYHWMVDCLPKLISLARAEPEKKITLLMSQTLGEVQRESLAALLPPHFEVQFHPPDTWFQVERFIWPSLVSGLANGYLPADYFEAIRRPIFQRYELPTEHPRTERLYITRRGAGRRRVLNEGALVDLLESYGFTTVELDKLPFREQVQLFHRAEVVVGPHGAGLNGIFFCGKIPVVVLHPNAEPQNHFHTLARGLGQDYHFVLHQGGIDTDFEVNLPALARVLDEELALQPMAWRADRKNISDPSDASAFKSG